MTNACNAAHVCPHSSYKGPRYPSSAALNFASLSLYRESGRRLESRSPQLIVRDVVEPVAVGVVAIGFEFDAVGFLRVLR